MRTIAITNQKGGVGKTTTTLGLANAFSRAGERVAVFDLDPQASATAVLEATGGAAPPTMTELLMQPEDVALEAILRPTAWGFDLAPADAQLVRREQQDAIGREFLLRDALDKAELDYDLVLIDCGPSLGVLSLNAMNAADELLIVTEPGYLSLKGLSDLLSTIEVVTRRTNPNLRLNGVVVNLVGRTREHAAGVDALRAEFGEHLIEPFIPRRTALQESMSRGVPLDELGAMAGAATAGAIYDRIAQEVTSRGTINA